MFKSIIILITCIMVIFFGAIFIQSTIYAPTEVNYEYEGIYYDNDNSELAESVNVVINGKISKDAWLKPKAFVGNISIGNTSIEITKPLLFSRLRDTNNLYLDDFEEGKGWSFHPDSLLKHFDSNAVCWHICMDKKFSMINIVPIESGISSTQRIAAPCNNREDAIKINRMLMSGIID
ncbi:MAG: hypothetical protein AAGU76_18470 [Sedimentibacter sp.]|uniref:hypothetical protein n=1 Tax=Sedimentibacter sp. TaxID=1960295 RepID=UPI003158BB33